VPPASILIGFDGSPASEHAIRVAGPLLAPRSALVVSVWEAGTAFEMAELPAMSIGMAQVPVDVRTATEIDQAMQERAQRMAQRGAEIAQEAGFGAEALAVADEITVAETLVRVAQERDAQAIVVGAHGHRGITERILGTTSQSVVHKAGRPVLVVRDSTD
jgi:nucleotide-binding universal stress UspA family protein